MCKICAEQVTDQTHFKAKAYFVHFTAHSTQVPLQSILVYIEAHNNTDTLTRAYHLSFYFFTPFERRCLGAFGVSLQNKDIIWLKIKLMIVCVFSSSI